MSVIRPARPGDRDALYDICLRTGDAGGDATGLVRDPELLGHIWAGPYPELYPDLAFVLEDDEGVAGYCVGAADTEEFISAFHRDWLPRLAGSHPAPSGPPANRDEELLRALHHPEEVFRVFFDGYPAHLHINLLPRAQGRGGGRALIETQCEALRERGCEGVHLGVRRSNTRARAFYAHVGFKELHEHADGFYFGRTLNP
ncbi:GNAT family N-acetyltransferase [Wenjunlia tyrosinilytica]|uniref:N-acetyltransferase domain-containing protein n=1 Tax=Wenjunlia tyrosinilytica TaxID=1544741 RepID=A0A918DV83_9ACTN|nr:GNAT family N-acetyltransferase [Wenjunlia tyrosinilytica]GGO85638.1 hypothetical protein GCM10012280_19880 [Wenjunlia tyrosinilytica]